MAGPKKGLPPPIDRPLSKAYLREFTGWSCAFPPGISDPTTLRLMENVHITREGAAAIRPALRSILPNDIFFDSSYSLTPVGSFEPFYSNSGKLTLLFAVREVLSGTTVVGFRCGIYNSTTKKFDIVGLTHSDLAFDMPKGYADICFTSGTNYVKYVQIDNKIFALANSTSTVDGLPGETMREFFVGTTKTAKRPRPIAVPSYIDAHKLDVYQPDNTWIAGAQTTKPSKETLSTTTLVSTDKTKNVYNHAYFYSFNNEVGESAMSKLTLLKIQRQWITWNMDLTNDAKSSDQLACVIPDAVYTSAQTAGAISWNLYYMSWSDENATPTEAVLLKTIPMVNATNDPLPLATNGWATHTPLLEGTNNSVGLPNATNRYNYSEPSRASNGLVAGDRLTLVGDKSKSAVIKWSSNQQGSYTDFSSSKGGGYKTLTSGNLYIPAAVKLWQNPQSVDTITIMCLGTNGYSTSYYMSPNTQITGQSQSTSVMGFEETTATPGTVSPFGTEVINNALYHPVDHALVKSSASNYNITHKTVTDKIQNRWIELKKNMIVSAELDNRLFLIVNNPFGAAKPTYANGNEIWVYDTAGGTEGTWSKYLIPAVSLKKVDIGGKLFMCVIMVDGFYVLDDLEMYDQINVMGTSTDRPIPWMLESNTQGANRAHDAWCHLQQVNIMMGNFYGDIKYGIRGWDINGKAVEMSKVLRSWELVAAPHIPVNTLINQSDLEDFFLIRKDLKEWRFFAESIDDQPSYGQINLVQYRYTPTTVNVGYEFGSIETFEYGRASTAMVGTEQRTDSGTPKPYTDIRRP